MCSNSLKRDQETDHEDRPPKLRVQFDAHHRRLTDAEKDTMLAALESLGRQTSRFPIADLHILIEGNE